LREALRITLSVVHIDHQLRGAESRADAGFVEGLATRYGLAFHLHRIDVGGEAARSGENLEQTARQVRLSVFERLRREGGVTRIAMGHTQSDQAETVLFRLLRGSGTTGLTGILPVTREGIVRPLLCVPRAEVESYLKAAELPWREDSSNRDARFTRNR